MKLLDFIKSKKIIILGQIVLNLLIIYFSLLRRENLLQACNVIFILDLFFLIYFVLYYQQLKKIISNLQTTETNLDKKFLVKEVQNNLNYEEELIFSVIENISKAQYQELKVLEKQLSEEKDNKLLWVHEIKQPLAILNAENISDYNRKKAVSRINKNLNQILKYEKIKSMGIDSKFVDVNLHQCICKALQEFSYELVEINPKISLNIDQTHNILTDKFWLQFIFEQIISNAIKYRSEQRLELEFNSQIINNTLVVKITDNGIGIEQYDLKNVFDKGYRGSNAKQKAQASGYGLYYVATIANKLNLKLSIDNNSNNQGITIELTTIINNKYVK